jgi:membrane protein required for colicin V production
MLTAFDVGIGVLVLISAILATARGFTREILSLATWAGSAAIAAYAYFNHQEIARGYIQEELVADVVTVAGAFIVALIVLHLITMRIADFVVDSRIGPLDRTLGFVFGVARGVLIAVVVVVFGLWLMPANLPDWAANSRSLPILEKLGNDLIATLPPDLEKQVTDILQRGSGAGEDLTDDAAPTGTPPDESTDLPENAAPPATNT